MSDKLPRGTLDRLWEDPANWRFGLYWCKSDPRIIVPKKIKRFGWTMNFIHPMACIALLIIIVSPAAPFIYLRGFNNPASILLFLAAWVGLLAVLCRILSSTTRYEDD